MSDPATPTGGKEGEAPPASPSGGTPASPAGGQAPAPQPGDAPREALIPRERFDEVNEAKDRLERENAELRAKANRPAEGQPKTWADVPQATLDTILADPIKYREHYAGAREEDRRRIITSAQTQATQAMTVEQLRAREADAFNEATPLGKEVRRIIAPHRSEAEYLQDAIELAKARLTVKPTATPGPALANNIAAALQTPPGGTNTPGAPPPNWRDMSKEDFEKAREGVLLGRGT